MSCAWQTTTEVINLQTAHMHEAAVPGLHNQLVVQECNQHGKKEVCW